MRKKSIVTVPMIFMMATTIISVLLHTEMDQIPKNRQFQEDREKRFLASGLVEGSVGSSETQVFTFLA